MIVSLIAALARATPEQLAAIQAFFPTEESVMVAPAIVSAPPKKSKPAKPAVLPVGEGIPTAADYRVDEVAHGVCISRRFNGGEDRRWKPFVYRESQCGNAVMKGSDICAKCAAKEERYAGDPSPKCDWLGRLTEEPFGWSRMLGTTWALNKPPVFLGEAAPVSARGGGAKAAPKAASPPPPPAAKAAPKAKAPLKAASPPPPPAAAAEDEAEEVSACLKLIDGNIYIVKDGNVYEYDEMAEKAGNFAGRLNPDGESIDTEAEEKSASEEDD